MNPGDPLYNATLKVDQLIDHITSGAQDVYFVHDESGGYGAFISYQEALDKFDSLTVSGYCQLYLATRIGTGVVIKEKENK